MNESSSLSAFQVKEIREKVAVKDFGANEQSL